MTNIVMTWSAFAIYGVFLAYLLAVIKYLVSQIFHIEEMSAQSKMEIQSLLFTLILFATLNALDFDNNIVTKAKESLNNYYTEGIEIYKGMVGMSSIYSLVASVGIQLDIALLVATGCKEGKMQTYTGTESGYLGAGIRPFSMFTPLMSSLSLFQSYLGLSFLNMQFHIQLLNMIHEVGKKILLPFGIFLRAFKITRNGGNALIAIFFALYMMYPLTINTFDTLIFGQNAPYSACGEEIKSSELKEMIYNEVINSLPVGGSDLKEMQINVANVADYVGSLKNNMCRYEGININGINISGINIIGKLFVLFGIKLMFMPFFAIFVALGFARVFASLLGTEIDFSSLIRVV